MMTSDTNFIEFALGIKDSNLIFRGYFYKFIRLIKYRVYEFTLIYPDNVCPECHQRQLVKFGFSEVNTKFTADDASHPVILRIHKQRVRCKNCQHTQLAQSPIVQKYCHIANKVRNKVIMSLQDDRTLDCIANDNNISPSTVNRYLDQSRAIAPLIKQELPINMALDEFRGVNRQLHFICIDNDGNHKIQAILPDRYKRTIENYFLSFPLQERARVKTISMDLNSYYQEIARRLFPNAQIIIDRFYVVAMLTRAFNQYRAQVMKRFEKTSRNYRLLKFSWRLYLVSEEKLSNVNEYYDRHIRQRVTSNERVDLGLQVDERLMADYNVMQSIMTNLSHRDMDGLTDALYPSEQISPQMTIVIKTLRQNLEYVLNASQFKYSNGAMEGINRMIKQIQRTAFGFRNFDHMVYRIYYRQMAQKKNQVA